MEHSPVVHGGSGTAGLDEASGLFSNQGSIGNIHWVCLRYSPMKGGHNWAKNTWQSDGNAFP
jgi:hypothetical protein